MNMDLPEHIPMEICNLAYQLHNERNENLSKEISSEIKAKVISIDELFEINGNILKFKSLEARNHCTAKLFSKKIIEKSTKEILLEAVTLWKKEISNTDFASGRLIALASQNISITEILSEATSTCTYDEALTLIGNALPFLQSKEVSEAAHLLTIENNENISSGIYYFFNGIRSTLKNNPNLADQLILISKKNLNGRSLRLYNTATTSMAYYGQHKKAIDLVLNDTKTNSEQLTEIALRTLGDLSIYWSQDDSLKNEPLKIIRQMMLHDSHTLRTAAFQGLTYSASNLHELIDELINYSGIDISIKLQTLSNFVMTNFANIKDTPNFRELLLLLSDQKDGDFFNLDHTLSKLVDDENHQLIAYETLTQWIIKNQTTTTQDEKLSETFPQTISSLSTNKLLSELLTKWLISDDKPLAIAFSDIIGYLWAHNFRTFSFSTPVLDQLTSNDFTYLSRRLLGWTFHEEALISLTFSLLNTIDAKHRSFEYVRALLIELGKNFPIFTLEEISNLLKSANTDQELLLKEVKDEITKYSEAINNLPNLSELRAPMRLRRAIRLKRVNANRDIAEQSRKSSILQLFAQKIPLKSGTGSFSTYNGELGPINRLSSFSTSVSLPALYVVDPLNDEINRLFNRSVKRGD